MLFHTAGVLDYAPVFRGETGQGMEAALQLTDDDYVAMERELFSRPGGFAEFVKEAWHVLEPGQPYVHGWHIDAITEHLEAVTSGDITRLLINVPPGTMKSLLASVFWQAWEWGPMGLSHLRTVSTSYEVGLATRDSLKMRRLVESTWYQQRWPTYFETDQNQKTYFENTARGFRQASAVKSTTGKRGDRLILDDPHNVEGALSAAERITTTRVFKETLPTRLNNPDTSAIIVIMQRLHEADVAGVILDEDLGYEHLCLPMEYERPREVLPNKKVKFLPKTKTAIGFSDPRKKEGELLFPGRFSQATVDEYKKVMGAYGFAGQMQQRPAPRTDGFFQWDRIETVAAAPELVKVIRYWDKAGTEGGGAWTAGVKMGVCKDGFFYVLDVVRGQWQAPKRERIIKQTAEVDGKKVKIRLEQEPGSGGKESAEATVRNLAGFMVKAERATGDKEVRAEPYSVQVEAGNIKMVRGPWNAAYLEEHKSFPLGKTKDQIDATSGAFNSLAGSRYRIAI